MIDENDIYINTVGDGLILRILIFLIFSRNGGV